MNIKKQLNREKTVYIRNEIKEQSRKIAEKFLPILALLMLVPSVAGLWSDSKKGLFSLYIGVFIFCILLIMLFRYTSLKKYPLVILYACASIFYILGIYLSVVNSPTQRATILLGVFCIAPLSIFDRKSRLFLFSSFFLMLHTGLAFYIKGPEIGADDFINCLSMMILGLVAGNMLYNIRIDSLEVRRQLMIEKETDVLTGLANRRKLFEMFVILEKENKNSPSGVLMLDIDHFKKLNDTRGHCAGDNYLRNFGVILSDFEKIYSMRFYRYGGEEFVALVWDYNEKELMNIAERIRATTEKMGRAGAKITVSIGVATCNREENNNYEYWIGHADTAAYLAKTNGRNRVELYQKEMEAVSC